jgi:UDP:flavonoid glycosyltransferase YjiC (YdhE family)
VDEARRELGLAPDPTGARLTDAPLLTTVPRELENSDTPEPVKLTRYRFPVRAEEGGLRDWWPGNDDPLVYLTFGSVAAGGHLPYYPQLYSWAIEALASLQIRLLVTVGDGERDLADLGAVPANVHVETWVPHDAAVRQAEVVVCHGGFGSTLGTLAHAVPLVVLPLFSSDQWANGEAVARAGAGLNVADDVSTRRVLDLPPREIVEGLAAAVKAALSDATYRREASRISDAMQALPPVDESVQLLEEIAT